MREGGVWLRSLLWLGALAIGVFLRVEALGRQALFGDEYHTHAAPEASFGDVFTTFDTFGSHVVLPLLQKLCVELLGNGTLAMRLPALVPGLLTLVLFYPFARRYYGRTAALLGTWALAIHPMHVYYSRFGRSYALILLLGLALLVCVESAVRRRGEAGPRAGARPWVPVFLLAVALPYTHLSSGGFVAAVALVATFLAWRRGAGLARPILAFAGAAAVVFALFVPLLEQVRFYFVEAVPADQKSSPETWFGIPLLMAGGAIGAWTWLILFPIGTALLLRERPTVALLGLAALAGPLVALVVTRPHGMEFAYARYLLLAVPLVPPVVAWGVERVLQRFMPVATAARATLALGLAAIVPWSLESPFLGERVPTGAFDNSYLAMRRLPAFDVPWPGAPGIYGELARSEEPLRVVETPPMLSRAVLLLRNHALSHGHPVRIGWPGAFPRAMQGDAYVSLDTIEPGVADVVIVHKNLRREVSSYWRFVYEEVWPGMDANVDRGFMLRHMANFVRGQPSTSPEFAEQVTALVARQLGPPTYQDEDVVVWWPGR